MADAQTSIGDLAGLWKLMLGGWLRARRPGPWVVGPTRPSVGERDDHDGCIREVGKLLGRGSEGDSFMAEPSCADEDEVGPGLCTGVGDGLGRAALHDLRVEPFTALGQWPGPFRGEIGSGLAAERPGRAGRCRSGGRHRNEPAHDSQHRVVHRVDLAWFVTADSNGGHDQKPARQIARISH